MDNARNVLRELSRKKESLKKEDLDRFRAVYNKDNPTHRQAMRYMKLNNRQALDPNDPLKIKYKQQFQEKMLPYEEANFEPYNWNQFKSERAPDLQGKTLQDILNEPMAKKPANPLALRGPATGYSYQIKAPEPDENYVYAGNRDNFQGSWQKIGDPITREAVGDKTYSLLTGNGSTTFDASHHNSNISPGSRFSDEELSNHLSERGISTDGDRRTLMQRYVNAAEAGDTLPTQARNLELSREGQQGIQPISDQMLQQGALNTQNENNQRALTEEKGRLQEANQLRQERMEDRGQMPIQNNSVNIQQQAVNPSISPVNRTNPLRLNGSQVSNAEASMARQWGQNNLANQAAQSSIRGLESTGEAASAARTGSLAARGSSGIAGRAAGMGALKGAAGFAERAMPLLNVALIAYSLLQSSQAGQKQKEAIKNQEAMMT